MRTNEEATVRAIIYLMPPHQRATLTRYIEKLEAQRKSLLDYIEKLEAQRKSLRLLWAAARDSGVVVPAGLLSDARATGAIRAIEEEI